jgi:hypothetical protein
MFKLKYVIIIMVFACPHIVWAACTGGGTSCTKAGTVYTCSDASVGCLSDVFSGTGVEAANDGDTINVTDTTGREWASTLKVNKGVKIIASPGVTITCSGAAKAMVDYTPSNYDYATGLSDTEPSFRFSGFTLDGAATCRGIDMHSASSNVPQRNVRIDHNTFQNMGANSTWGVGIWHDGVWGVVDNNTFTNLLGVFIRSGNGGNREWWDHWNGIEYGSAKNLYIEDNTFTNENLTTIGDCQVSSRYLYRYNEMAISQYTPPILDLHGNFTSSGTTNIYSCFGGEVYGNNITSTAAQWKLVDQRGGKMIVAMNNCTACDSNKFTAQVRQESYVPVDSPWPTDNSCSDNDSPANTAYCAADGAKQYINDSYFWANRTGYTNEYAGGAPSIDTVCGDYNEGEGCKPPAIDTPKAGRDYFSSASTPGITCGTLGNRPNCTAVNQAYWATDQSCSSLEGHVGAGGDLSTKKIVGDLYVCTETGTPGTWIKKFTPYTYPHPLRGTGKAAMGLGSGASMSITAGGATLTLQ